VQGVGRAERIRIAEQALAKVGLTDWAARYPSELSGGMQQRVGLARAISADPEIILMDEPFSALDPLIRRQLQDEFRQLTKELGKSAVFITHDLDEAIRLGDRIAIMKDGAIIQVGTAEEIVLHPADDYVAEFVAGISRLHLIKAHSVMTPVAVYKAAHPGFDAARLASVSLHADIDEVIGLAVNSDHDTVAVVETGVVVGVITLRDLLRGVQGHSNEFIEAAEQLLAEVSP
jgi:glycine betaine/proline transport system ATP-binding protein